MEQEQANDNKILQASPAGEVGGGGAIENQQNGQDKERLKGFKEKFLEYWAIPITCISVLLVVVLLGVSVGLLQEKSYLSNEVSRLKGLVADYEYSWNLIDELGLGDGLVSDETLDENTEDSTTNSFKKIRAYIVDSYGIDEDSIEYRGSVPFTMCPAYLTTCFRESTLGSEYMFIDTKNNDLSLSDVEAYFSEKTEFKQIETRDENEKLYQYQYGYQYGPYYDLKEVSSDGQSGIKISVSANGSDVYIPAKDSAFTDELNELSEAKKSRTGEYPSTPFQCLRYDDQIKHGFEYPTCMSQSGRASYEYLYNNGTNKIVELLYGIDTTVYGSVYYYRTIDPATREKTKWAFATCERELRGGITKEESEIFYCIEQEQPYDYVPMIRDEWIVLN